MPTSVRIRLAAVLGLHEVRALLRLLGLRGLHPISRLHFLLGAMGYVSSALWLLLLLAGTGYVLMPELSAGPTLAVPPAVPGDAVPLLARYQLPV